MVEDPQPPVPFADPQAGLVGLQDRFPTGAGRGCGWSAWRRRPGRVEDVDERALADVEAEEIGQQRGQALEGDALGEAQIDDEGAQVGTKGRTFRHVLRRRRLECPGAARAGSAQKRNARHIRNDRRDFDMVIGLADELRRIQKEGAAMLAGGGEHIPLRRRIGMKRAVRPRMRLAPLSLGRLALPARALASLAWWRAGILGRLRRQVELGAHGIFPDYAAPIVRNQPDGRELAMARWGMPSPLFALKGKKCDPGVTNVRNVNSPHWRRWLAIEHRCVAPFTSFSENEALPDGARPPVWFAFDESRPLAFFAGIWTNWTSVRKVKEGETNNDVFAFLTTEPNAVVAEDPSQSHACHTDDAGRD